MNLAEAFDVLTAKLAAWGREFVLSLPNMLIALVVVVVFWVAGRVVRTILLRALRRMSHNDTINRLLAATAFLAVLATGLFIALGILNLDKTVTSLLTGAGIAALIVGFAFQDIASNAMAGILLSVRHPLRAGHLVETQDHMGIVQSIDLRVTTLRTLQGQVAFLPNKEVLSNPILNFSVTGVRRIDLPVSVSYGDDLEVARRLAIEAVGEVSHRDTAREIEFFWERYGENAVEGICRIWIHFQKQTDFLQARSEAIVRIKAAWDRAGIVIPWPIRTLDFGAKGGERLAEVLSGAPKERPQA